MRVVNRQIRDIQREEEKVKRSVKDAAEKGQKDVCVVLAKEMIRNPGHYAGALQRDDEGALDKAPSKVTDSLPEPEPPGAMAASEDEEEEEALEAMQSRLATPRS
ncbi:Charged multivesicular body protein 3 [Tupaia chinensis]|uniref:Charged multivesicular body protein 3 n=1 Tax=Tupaia chinensis TaxID=246437 RepID=L9LCN1_TUPCH|nr:Charged multivesicular body protein 3 [Tupaia chinensis]